MLRTFSFLLSLACVNTVNINWAEYGPKPLCETCEELQEQVGKFTKHGPLDELTATFLCDLAEFEDEANMKAVGGNCLQLLFCFLQCIKWLPQIYDQFLLPNMAKVPETCMKWACEEENKETSFCNTLSQIVANLVSLLSIFKPKPKRS